MFFKRGRELKKPEKCLTSPHLVYCLNHSVKGINQMTTLYHNQGTSLSVHFKMLHKTVWVEGVDFPLLITKQVRFGSPISKRGWFRSLQLFGY